MSNQLMAVTLSVLGAICSVPANSQQNPSPPATPAVAEFPVMLQQNVVAGKTPAATKIQAKLEVATLLQGQVIPKNAVFSGEVIDSVAKSTAEPSRLAIRMDSAQWKNGSAALKIYLTAWYYPTVSETTAQNLQYGPEKTAKGSWNGMGQYPDPNSPAYRPFPAANSDKGSAVPDTPASVASNRRVPMKNVQSEQGADGAITIVSKKANIKLDKLTTYVLAAADLPQAPAKPSAAK
jgi:hypothetical protein